ncbi:MAG: methyl-accepting chemotaxis protein [Pseudomonadales bacterium]
MSRLIMNLDVRKKLRLIPITVLLVLLGAALLSGLTLRQNLLEERQLTTRELVESASAVLSHFEQRERSGELNREQAQRQAAAVIAEMRYAGKGYFWINNTGGDVVMHPLKPKIVGKNMLDTQDGSGKYHWREFVEVVARDGAGFVDYTFLLKSENFMAHKIAYLQGFEPWGWIVGTGIYVDDVEQLFYAQLRDQLLLVALCLLLILTINYFISASVVKPVRELSSLINRVRGDKLLSLRTGFEHRDEIGRMGADLDALLGDIERFVGQVKGASEQLFVSADELTSISGDSNVRMNRQHSSTELVSNAMREMTEAAADVSSNASSAVEVASSANQHLHSSSVKLKDTMQTMQQINGRVQDVSGLVTRLDQSTAQISTVLGEIRGIADQTNLLALNAAIEAARAGEMGRGFAVVADEVRTLAMRTQSSTSEIDEMIAGLQSAMAQLTKVMGDSVSSSKQGFEQVAAVSESLGEVVVYMGSVDTMSAQIASAAKQQSSVSLDINDNLVSINRSTSEALSDSQQVIEISEQTRRAAERMQHVAGQYR